MSKLAALLGVDKGTISRWEQGGLMEADNLQGLVEHLGGTAEWIMKGGTAPASIDDPRLQAFLTELEGTQLRQLVQGWMISELEHARLPQKLRNASAVYMEMLKDFLATRSSDPPNS